MRKFAARYSPASEARSGDAAKLSGYLAKTGAFDQAIGEFRLRGVTWRTGVECNRTLETGALASVEVLAAFSSRHSHMQDRSD